MRTDATLKGGATRSDIGGGTKRGGFRGPEYGCRNEDANEKQKAKEEAGPLELGMTSEAESTSRSKAPLFAARKMGHPARSRSRRSKSSKHGDVENNWPRRNV